MLRSNQISCIDNSTFTGLSSVRLLSLYDNGISSITPGAFFTLHSLSTMWVILDSFHIYYFSAIVLFIIIDHLVISTLLFVYSRNLAKCLRFLCIFLCFSPLSANFSLSLYMSYLTINKHTHTHTHYSHYFLDFSPRRCSPSLVTRWVCIPGHLLSKLNISQHLHIRPPSHTHAHMDTRLRPQSCLHEHLLQQPSEILHEEFRRLQAELSWAQEFLVQVWQ